MDSLRVFSFPRGVDVLALESKGGWQLSASYRLPSEKSCANNVCPFE